MRFAIDRIKKIYPSYIITMFFMLPYSIIKDMEDASIGMALVKGIIKLAGGVPLIQSVTGSTYTSHALNAVCWFLSTLFICYIFSPILIKLVNIIQSKVKIVLPITIAVTVIWMGMLWKIESYFKGVGIPYINDLEYGSPYARIWFIFIGMLIASMYNNRDRQYDRYIVKQASPIVNDIICDIVIIVSLIYYFARNVLDLSPIIIRSLDIIICVIFIWTLLNGRGLIIRLLENEKLADFGKKSFIIFLWHFPIITYVDYIYEEANLRYALGEVTGIIELIIIILIVSVIYLIYQKKRGISKCHS